MEVCSAGVAWDQAGCRWVLGEAKSGTLLVHPLLWALPTMTNGKYVTSEERTKSIPSRWGFLL